MLSDVDLLVDDILLIVFDHLNENDLVNCEAVCRRWQNLLRNQVWKNILRKKVKCIHLWRKCWESLMTDKYTSHLESWELYKLISIETQALNDNWQKGNFSLKTYPFDERLEGYFSMNEKYLVMLQGDVGLNVYERSSMKLTHKMTSIGSVFTCFQLRDDVIMCGTMAGTIQVYDLVSGEVVHEFCEPKGWSVRHLQFGYQGLAVAISSDMDGSTQLTFWQMRSPSNITYLHSLLLDEGKGDMFTLGMDDHFVVLFRYVAKTPSRKIYIISTETKTVVEKLTIAYSEYLLYDQGVIIMRFPLFIRVAPLFPGKKRPINCFVDLFLGFEHEADRTTFRANSKYLVVTCALPVEGTTVMIYDLEAIKRGNRDNIPFIYKVPFKVYQPEIDETQMVCLGGSRVCNRKEIAVFDFSRNLSFFFLKKYCSKLDKQLKPVGYTNVTELDNHAIFSVKIKRKVKNIFLDFCLPEITNQTKLGKIIHFSNSCFVNLWPLFLIVLVANRCR